jgi:hypothetical protein
MSAGRASRTPSRTLSTAHPARRALVDKGVVVQLAGVLIQLAALSTVLTVDTIDQNRAGLASPLSRMGYRALEPALARARASARVRVASLLQSRIGAAAGRDPAALAGRPTQESDRV